MSKAVLAKFRVALEKDPEIAVDRTKAEETLGSDPRWLLELGLTKGNLIQLERIGLALKARYSTKQGHRVRWILFKEAA